VKDNYHGEYNADLNGAINMDKKIERAAGEPARNRAFELGSSPTCR